MGLPEGNIDTSCLRVKFSGHGTKAQRYGGAGAASGRAETVGKMGVSAERIYW